MWRLWPAPECGPQVPRRAEAAIVILAAWIMSSSSRKLFPRYTKALCDCSYGEFGEYAHHLQDLIGFSSELHALRIDLIANEIGPPGESLTPSRDQVRYEARSRASLVNFGALLQPSAAFAAARCSWCTRTSGHSCGPHSKLA
jgi:hypothetical protein